MIQNHASPLLARFVFAVLKFIEPIFPVRFVPILASRIGHCAGDIDLFLRTHPRSKGYLFFVIGPIANIALVNLWKSKLHVIHQGFIGRFFNRWLLGKIIKTRFFERRDPTGQEYKAWHTPGLLASHNLPRPYEKFVVFHARDSSYLKQVQPETDFSYHDFRDALIANCLPAAEYITERGYYAVRMGSIVAQKLKTNNPNIIDAQQDEERDLRLAANCLFYIGTNNGAAQLPLLFDKPLAYTNSVPLWMLNWGKDSLFIPKLFRSKDGDKFLTFQELYDLGAFDHKNRTGLQSEWYEERGIIPVENTAEDILDLCRDMFRQIKRKPPPNQRQREYKIRFFSSQHEHEWAPNIGPSFVAKYQGLLA